MATGTARQRATARALVREHGTTYAEDAGITLRDKPSPLWRLLTLSLLLSARISSDIAVAAGRERTATQLGAAAARVLDDWRGDLRRLYATAQQHSGDDVTGAVEGLLQEFTGIGPSGAAIFCREAQAVWPALAPYVDEVAARGAARLALPRDPEELAQLVPRKDRTRLVAGCVRAARDDDVVADVTG